jgi:hypothetical protein
MVSGDSESIDGHVIYEYADYATWAAADDDEDDEGNPCIRFGSGAHDEEPDWFFAYYGPIAIPDYVPPAPCPGEQAQEPSTEKSKT